MFLSIIVPVYNSRQYLRTCLDSLRRQTFQDFEVLLIDDCSTDDSGAICREYCRLDQRFLYLKNEANIGTAASRNVGIKAARGTYITFFDNDDWCDDPFAFENLSAQIESDAYPDVVCYETKNYWENTDSLEEPRKPDRHLEITSLETVEERLRYLLKNGAYYSAVWSKTIKRELVNSCDILFPEGRRNEDTAWSLELLYHVDSISWFDKPFYIWRRNSFGSQSSRDVSFSQLRDVTWLINYHIERPPSSTSPERRLIGYQFISYIYVIALSYIYLITINKQDEPFYKEICESLFQRKNLLDYCWDKRVKLARLAASTIGIKLTARILSLVMLREKKMIRSR